MCVGLLDSLREIGPDGRVLRRRLEQGRLNSSSGLASETDPDAQLADALTSTQLKLVQYILVKKEPVSFRELRNHIWRGRTSDGNIEKAVYRTNQRLLEETIPLTLYTKNGHVSATRLDR
jgi:hypothetical protein